MGVITTGLVTKGIVAPAQSIYYVDRVSSYNAGNVSSLGTTPAPSTAPGDLMIGLITNGSASAGTWTPPAGWSEVVDQGASPNLTVAWKIAVAVNPVASWSSTVSSPIGFSISTFRNALIDVVGAVSPVVTGTNDIVMPSITTTVANTLVIVLAVSGDAYGNTVPTGYTQLWSTSGNPTGIAVFARLQATAGATGTATMNWTYSPSNAPGNAAGVLISIKPR